MSEPAVKQHDAIERFVRQDRLVIMAAIAVISGLAWAYFLSGAGTGMPPSGMTTWQFPPPRPDFVAPGSWDGAYWLSMLIMWVVMMVAMMLPSAAPFIILHAAVYRRGQQRGQYPPGAIPTGALLAGYLTSWSAFSVAATLCQFGLEQARLMDGMMMWTTDRTATGLLLLLAGLYQISSFKGMCLEHCRSPVGWLSRHWRDGTGGAFLMGVQHGLYCIGCCAGLMILLFAAGIMNLVWIASLAILVLIEKITPYGAQISKLTGGLLLLAALVVLIAK